MTDPARMRSPLLKVTEVLETSWFRRTGLAAWLLAWLIAVVLLLTPLDVPAPKGSDKLAHLLLFGTLAFMTVGFCRSPRRLFLLAGLTLLGGYLLELGQLLVPARAYDNLDAVANGAGAALGFVLAVLLAQALERLARAGRDTMQPGV